MSEFTPQQERRLNQILDGRLKASKHEAGDHLDNALLPGKLAPGNANGAAGTAGNVLTVNASGRAAWATPDAAGAKVGMFTCPVGTGNYQVTGVGFQPRLVQFYSGFSGGGSNDYLTTMSGATDGTNQWYAGSTYRKTTTLAASYSATGACIAIPIEGAAGTFYVAATIVSFDSGGFTLNFAAVNAGFNFGWIATR